LLERAAVVGDALEPRTMAALELLMRGSCQRPDSKQGIESQDHFAPFVR